MEIGAQRPANTQATGLDGTTSPSRRRAGGVPATRSTFVLALAMTLAFALAGSLLLDAPPAGANPVLTVNLTGDAPDLAPSDGRCDVRAERGLQCTLRAAIRQANENPGADTIHFRIPGGGVKTIRPDTDLPFILQPLNINGYTQPGSRPNTAAAGTNAVLRIQLDGGGVTEEMPEHGDGLHVHAPNTTIRGLAIGRFHEGIQGHRPGRPHLGDNGSKAHGVNIAGNFIGTDATGTRARPNQTGIEVWTSHVSVGGDGAGSRNLISGNTKDGLQFATENGETGAMVTGNLIGTDRSGVTPLGNGRNGILTAQSGGMIGSHQTPGAANTIRFNGGDGVSVISGAGNHIMHNSISDNAGLGIDLGDDGPTPNDPNDRDDTPANHGQNFPRVTSANRDADTSTTTITGQLNSNPNQAYTIQCFATGTQANPSEQGKTPLDTTTTTTAADGDSATFTCTSDLPAAGDTVSMTATNKATGDTSEFSEKIEVTNSTQEPPV